MNNSLREKQPQDRSSSRKIESRKIESRKQITLQKLVSFSVCLCSFMIIEDGCCNGLADDVFPSLVSSGPHCTKTNLQCSENRSPKVGFHELSGLFLLFTVERIIFPDHLLDMGHFHSHFMDLWVIQNLTEISFIPCLFSYW